jgi:hypothetical protein
MYTLAVSANRHVVKLTLVRVWLGGPYLITVIENSFARGHYGHRARLGRRIQDT